MFNGMYDYDIENILHCLFGWNRKRRVQYNVLCADELANHEIHTYPLCLVVNNKECKYAGEHWVCFFKKEANAPLEFFCSYGRSVFDYGRYFVNFQENNSEHGFVENKLVLQSNTTLVCGLYVIFYLYKRMMGKSRESISKMFSRNIIRNDHLVMIFVKKILAANKFKLNHRCKHLFDSINKRVIF